MYSNTLYRYVYAIECVRKFYFNLIFKEKIQTYSFVRVGNVQERCFEYLQAGRIGWKCLQKYFKQAQANHDDDDDDDGDNNDDESNKKLATNAT